MANYNKVLLMGNLTRDIELRNIPSGQAVANIGLAVNRTFTDREGTRREETTFVDCEAWGKTAEIMAQYLSKGKPVFVEGRLKLDTWQDKDGGNRSKLRVVIENFQFIDSKGGGGGSNGGGRAPVAAGTGHDSHEPISEDDIPF
jgi:single-strand DNA-binding protein